MEEEINIMGVYISPFALLLVVTFALFLPLRSYLDRVGFSQMVWHRSLADACIFVIILGLLVIIL